MAECVLLLFALAALADTQTIPSATFPWIESFTPVDSPLLEVRAPAPGLTWSGMNTLCIATFAGTRLLYRTRRVADDDADAGLCAGESLVPFGAAHLYLGSLAWEDVTHEPRFLTSDELASLHNPDLYVAGSFAAVTWPGLAARVVDVETFTCAICEATRRKLIATPSYPPHDNAIFAYDLQLVSYREVDDVASVADGGALGTQLIDDLALAFNVSVGSLRWHGAALDAEGKATVHVFYDPGVDDKINWFYVHWNDDGVKHKEVTDFAVTSIKLNTECIDRSTVNSEGNKKRTFLAGDTEVTTDTALTVVSTWECYWDAQREEALWSGTYNWTVNWGICDFTGDGMKTLMTPGPEQKRAVQNFNLVAAFQLKHFLDADTIDLKAVLAGTNLFLLFHCKENFSSAFEMLSLSMPINLALAFTRYEMPPGKSVQISRSPFVSVMLADAAPENPVVGCALAIPCQDNKRKSSFVELYRTAGNQTPSHSHIEVTVSDSIASSAGRLAVATYAAHLDEVGALPYDTSIDGWMSMVQVVFTNNDTAGNVGGDDDYVDIAFRPTFHNPALRGKCAERVIAKDAWDNGKCRVLKSQRDAMLVCRCKRLQREPGMTNVVYLVFGADAGLSSFLANNISLIVVMVLVSLFSAFGLASVFMTALCFPTWREDQGHKIFLQMMLALAVNLLLGFTNNFFNIDTKSVACIVVGALRHYSFLAMFFWMMILSGLQLLRLTTIAGAKATTHLILKVSAIAWGLPLIPIVTLVSWDTGFYKSEVTNRGYCYPEGVAFQVTVQAPVGVILGANLLIFFVILNQLYGCVECGKTVAVRKHASDDKAAQVRRLLNSIFIFFLFGFTWLFHFLSEEGIINSEFLFEFMFLITAAFHIFMLSLFFIALDKGTRTLWQRRWNANCTMCPCKEEVMAKPKIMVRKMVYKAPRQRRRARPKVEETPV